MEAVEELVVAGFFGRQHGCFPERALGSNFHQLARNRANTFLQTGAAFLPSFAAQPVQRDTFLAAAIAAEHVDIFDRDEQLVAASIFQSHTIVQAFARRDGLQPDIFADTVIEMHDQVTARQGLQFGEESVGILLALLAADQPVTQQILLGNQLQLIIGKTGVERQDHGSGFALCRGAERFLPAFRDLYRRARFLNDRGDAAERSLGICRQQRTLAGLGKRLEMLRCGFIGIAALRAFGREIARRAEAEIEYRVALGLVEDGGLVDRPCGQRAVQFILCQIKLLWINRAIAALGLSGDLAALTVIIGNVGQPFFRRRHGSRIDHECRIFSEMVEQSRHPVFEQW